MARRYRWMLLLLATLALSAGAVWVLVARPPIFATSGLWRIAEAFASPGELLWLVTLGDVFAGPPSYMLGIAVRIFGSALFWLLAAAAVVWFARRTSGPRR